MTQEEQIEKAAKDFHNHEIMHSNGGIWEDGYREGCALGFVTGAHWALSHKWISVDDELPKENGRYLVYAPTYKKGSSSGLDFVNGIGFSRFAKGKWSIEIGYHKRPNCVTHWMLIPKPKEK